MELKTEAQLNIEKPKPGIYVGVKDSKYFKVKALNNSSISTMVDKTPAHYQFEKQNPDNSSTDSQMLGSVAHATLLQPERLADDVKAIPTISKRTNKFFFALADLFPEAGITKDNNWGQAQELIAATYPDIILAAQSQVDQAAAMIRKLKYDDKQVGNWKLHTVMNTGHSEAEVVFVWEDETTGLLCKAKFDWFNFEIGFGFDYKTAKDASPQKFRYSVSDYGYHRQLVHYYRGAIANDVDLQKNAILAQESSAPYPHAWYEFEFEPTVVEKATGEEWDIARYQLDTAMHKIKWCTENDKWPGYMNTNGKNVFPITLKFDDYRDYRDNPFEGNDEEIEQIFSSVTEVEQEQPTD